ncbi:hypothetical protein [Ferrovum myxofaciens]|uniref:hypothetical protein n=1 Tax=Ferrovum myxofaciens TaxID=416213 RepID=UPI001AFB88DE|nr:hypothetical protein [Ferrovum myxofaciens]QSH81861.1 MAG: hypothetical protein HO273_13965 [Ferrovum myxofaciens]
MPSVFGKTRECLKFSPVAIQANNPHGFTEYLLKIYDIFTQPVEIKGIYFLKMLDNRCKHQQTAHMTLTDRTYDHVFRQNRVLGAVIVLSLCVSLFCALAMLVHGNPVMVVGFLVSVFFFFSFPAQSDRDLLKIGNSGTFSGLVPVIAQPLPLPSFLFATRTTTPTPPPPRHSVLA